LILQEFEIEGSPKRQVTERGVRAHIYSIAEDYGLNVAPTNVNRNLVRVVVKGEQDQIGAFHKQVLAYCKTELKLAATRISKLKDWDHEPDWQALANSFNIGQLSKGIEHLQSIDNKFGNALGRFDSIGRGVREVQTQVQILPELVKEVRALRQDTVKEVKAFQETVSRFTDVLDKVTDVLNKVLDSK
jgi:malonyl CoA-acyl carrier protein transacylase